MLGTEMWGDPVYSYVESERAFWEWVYDLGDREARKT